MKNKIIFISIIFYVINLSNAFSANFKNYLELSECIDHYKSFASYKSKLNKCFKNQKINLDKNAIKLIKKKTGIIGDIIELELPNK